MINDTWTYRKQNDVLFWGFSIITIISILAAVSMYSILPIAVPLGLIGLYFAIVDVKFVFYALIAMLAFSTEIELPNGIGTELPGEPLMLLVTGLYGIFIFSKPQKAFIPLSYPITQLLLLHLAWIAITIVTSENPIVSTKFLLAKIWYVVPFYFTPFLLLKEKVYVKKLIYILMTSVLVASFYVMAMHLGTGLSFEGINKAVQPFFRNHVDYACLLVITLPYIFIVYWQSKKTELALILLPIVFYVLIAIYFTYTRAAMGSVVIGAGAYFALKYKLTKLSFAGAIVGALLVLGFMVQQNRFMDYAPNFEKTITHKDFDNLLEATAKGEDISTMERVYRWVAGVQMIVERPIVGYGANNFYPYYKKKTLASFETYVSDNPEKSGIHSYYLMTAVEQGIPGLIIFLTLLYTLLITAERTYHRLKDSFYQLLVAAAYVSIVIILSLLVVNDLLEADKVGPFFFLAAAFIVLANRQLKAESKESD